MAVKPIVLALSRSGEVVAHRVAEVLGAQVHGREGRVEKADAFFPNALDHARDLFAAGVPIVGVCASGILIRAVAPLLADKTIEPPVISVSDDGAVVVPLLGGHRGANRLAAEIIRGAGCCCCCHHGGGCCDGRGFGCAACWLAVGQSCRCQGRDGGDAICWRCVGG